MGYADLSNDFQASRPRIQKQLLGEEKEMKFFIK
jgi:hypothetical protein